MPFNGVLLVSTANRSAELWQQAACLRERISSEDMLDLVVCFPLHLLGRWALYLWTYLCYSPYSQAAWYSDDDSDDDDASSASYYGYDSSNHSD